MSENIPEEAEQTEYITFEPQTVKFLSESQMQLAVDYPRIVGALRKKGHMSVKEIYELYYIPVSNSYEKTLKTIYRYVEKLEIAGLVTVAGYRRTAGNKTPEKLYCRTANLFYPDPTEEDAVERSEDFIQQEAKRYQFFLEQLTNKAIDANIFYSVFKSFSDQQDQIKVDLLELAKTNPAVAEQFSQIKLDKINSLMNSLSALGVFLQKPELLEQFQRVLET